MSYEVEYTIPFEILFDGGFRDTWEAKKANFSNEVASLLKLLGVEINANALADKYCNHNHGQGDVHVFFDSTKNKFVMFDLYLGLTDQNNMIVLAMHVPYDMKDQIKVAMLAIYNDDDAIPKSDFYEYYNNKLLTGIDKSNYPKKCESNYQEIFYYY